ncbi:MAG: pseudouridine synthase [Bacteroidota bacterium]
MPHYFQIYKPYGILSQFSTDLAHKRTLASLYDFPSHVYPIGRLDEDSEGLLLLTDDKRLNQQLLGQGIEKEYWVQVEGKPTEADLQPLREGVSIRVKKKTYQTLPAKVEIIANEPPLPARNPPIRFRKAIPTTWLAITLREGKNRQVRKMTAKVGFPTLRLVRWRLGPWTIENYKVGEVRIWDR